MGRLAELFEKKANGTITEEEVKEFDQLQKEAATISGAGEQKQKQTEGQDEDAEQQVDKLAQQFADSVTNKIGGFTEKMDNMFKSFEEKANATISGVHDNSNGYVFDKSLGKKVPVAELGQQKVVLSDRKSQNKSVTEVSMKTVHFLEALAHKNVEKLQVLSEGTAADGGYEKLALV